MGMKQPSHRLDCALFWSGATHITAVAAIMAFNRSRGSWPYGTTYEGTKRTVATPA